MLNIFKNLYVKAIDFITDRLLSHRKNIKSIKHNMQSNQKFNIVKVEFNSIWNQYNVTLMNQSDIRNKEFISTLWNTLNSISEWTTCPRKIMMVAFLNPETGKKFYIHKNVAIVPETSASDYYEEVKNILRNYWKIGSISNKEDYSIIIVEFHPYTEEDNKNSSTIKKNKSSTIKNIFFIFICGIYFILNMLVLIHLNNPIIQKGIYIYLIIISLLIIIKNILRLYLLHKFYTDNKKGKTLILSKALPNKIRIFNFFS